MGMKDMDFKKVLLHKGERIGLGVAVAIMALLLFMGVSKAVSGGSAASTAAEIENMKKSADQRITNAEPPPPPEEEIKKFVEGTISFWLINPDQYALDTPLFVPTSIEDRKRRNPDVLSPIEFQTAVFRTGLRGYIFNNRQQALVLVDKSLSTKLPGAGRFGSGMMSGMPQSMPEMGGEAEDGSSGGESLLDMLSGGEGSDMMMMMMPPMEGPAAKQKKDTMYVDFSKLDRMANAKLAEKPYPVHVAVVAASFPYKAQLEEFRRALRLRSLNELVAMMNTGEVPWEFKGFEVQRRVRDSRGNLVGPDFSDYTKTIIDALRYYASRSVGIEAEDSNLTKYPGLLNMGLLNPRPLLARDEKYPEVKLETLDQAIAKLDEATKSTAAPILSPRAKKLGGVEFDPFNPIGSKELLIDPNMMGMDDVGMGGMGSAMMRNPLDASMQAANPMANAMGTSGEFTQMPEPIVPEACLIRFLDMTVRPGYTYEYRIKLKMTNPNYGRKNVVAFKTLADKQVLTTDWIPVDKPVTVPVDSYYYVYDQPPEGRGIPAPPSRDQVALQFHRWLDYLEMPGGRFEVANWTIAERVLVNRGEYISRVEQVELPIWLSIMDDYVLATNTRGRMAQRKVPVDFTTRPHRNAQPAILVDFEGGKNNLRIGQGREQRTVSDESAIQVLVMMPDGKMIVRNGNADEADEERTKRVDAHRKWVKEVKDGKKKSGPGSPLFDKNLPRANFNS